MNQRQLRQLKRNTQQIEKEVTDIIQSMQTPEKDLTPEKAKEYFTTSQMLETITFQLQLLKELIGVLDRVEELPEADEFELGLHIIYPVNIPDLLKQTEKTYLFLQKLPRDLKKEVVH